MINVLLVEDDEDDFLITRDVFQRIGGEKYDLTWASTYDEGLEKLASGDYDIHLFDYRLGRRTGIELLREGIRRGIKKPIIMLTGLGSRDIDMEAMSAGAADYLVKSQLSPERLERAIRYTLDHWKAEHALERRLEFEKLVMKLAARFINLRLEEIDECIIDSFGELGRFAGLSRSYVFLFNGSCTSLVNSHEWHLPQIEPRSQELFGIPSSSFKWWVENIAENDFLRVMDFDLVPSEAQQQKRSLHPDDTNGCILFPISFGGKQQGFVGFDADDPYDAFSDGNIPILQTVAAIIGNALGRKDTERALHASEERRKAIASNLPIILWSADGRGVLHHIEGRGLELLGLQASSLPGKHIAEAIPKISELSREFDSAMAGHSINSVLETGDAVFVSYMSPLKTETGAISGVIGVAMDITRRHAVEEQLRQRDEQLRAVVSNVPVILYATDLNASITLLEGKGLETVGHVPGFGVGKSLYRLFADMPAVIQNVREVYDGLSHTWESKFNRVVFQHTAVPLRSSGGEVRGLLAVAVDITERKRIERMKSEFISVVSHELRTPLTSILGSLSLLSSGVCGLLSSQALDLIDIAQKNGDRLLKLISDIIDIEKIESGIMEIICRPQEILPVIEQSITMNESYGKQYDITLALRKKVSTALVNVDAERLMQAMTNLLSNAVKYSPTGGVVEVVVKRKNQRVVVQVHDDGPGIPEEFHDRIFQKFAQADSSDTRRQPGTGLGLSITKAVIEAMGGRLGFLTEEGAGTTFFFEFPEWIES